MIAIALWLLTLAAAALIIARTTIRTDMGAFLPATSSPAEQALTDQVNTGPTSHLILAAIGNAPPAALAALSQSLAARLRQNPAFADIANGDPAAFAATQTFIWQNRYLLSPAITQAHFAAPALHTALENDLGLLASDAGPAFTATLAADPTGEALTLMSTLTPPAAPRSENGIWVSPDAATAILLIHTAAPGFDIDAQQHALTTLTAAFAAAKSTTPGAGAAILRETGPGIFAVHIRDTTKSDVTRLSLLATGGAVLLLLFAYRSPRIILLGLLPVATGAAVATAAVALAFGFVHGITLGFGVTLIGESLDYAIYLFTQTAPAESPAATIARIWPTLRLGAATSVAGFAAMLASSFTGFAQLGLFSITGLAAAACVTRFVLPHFIPAGFSAPGSFTLAKPLLALISRRARLLPIAILAVAIAAAALLTHRGPLWDANLANLSPLPPADQALDQTLRHDLGIPDQRDFALLQAPTEQAALTASETLAPTLQSFTAAGALAGFDLPSLTLPSLRTQRRRQSALPDGATLRETLAQAETGLPFRPNLFTPFLAAIAAARTAPLITPSTLPTPLALRVATMLSRHGPSWTILAPLQGVQNPAAIATAFAAAAIPTLAFIDLDHESAALLNTFQSDAEKLAIFGSLAILLILAAFLRSPRRVAAIAAPLIAAVIVTAALLTCGGQPLTIFKVTGFLLIIAVGSNYCLFFARPAPDPAAHQRAIGSIVLANLCTVAAYGLMSFSRIPVLHDIGQTVALGTFLVLIFGATLSPPRHPA